MTNYGVDPQHIMCVIEVQCGHGWILLSFKKAMNLLIIVAAFHVVYCFVISLVFDKKLYSLIILLMCILAHADT